MQVLEGEADFLRKMDCRPVKRRLNEIFKLPAEELLGDIDTNRSSRINGSHCSVMQGQKQNTSAFSPWRNFQDD